MKNLKENTGVDQKKKKKISRKEKLAKALKLNIKLRKGENKSIDRNIID